jgi:hypothetical protein
VVGEVNVVPYIGHYVGVTGFTDKSQVEQALAVPHGTYQGKVMVGVLVSYKTLHGLPKSFHPNRYPSIGKVGEIFTDHPRALNLIHYGTHVKDELFGQLMALTQAGGPNLHGFQLNIPWPDLGELSLFRMAHPELTIVLQVGEDCLASVGYNPDRLARLLLSFRGIMDQVLFDQSGGKGQPPSFSFMISCVSSLLRRTNAFSIGVAGGMHADNLEKTKFLKPARWPVNIDAEGRLRDKEDNIDMKEVVAYLEKAYQIFGQ